MRYVAVAVFIVWGSQESGLGQCPDGHRAVPTDITLVGSPTNLTPESFGGEIYFPRIEANRRRGDFLLAFGVNDDAIHARRVQADGTPMPGVHTVAGKLVGGAARPVLEPGLAYNRAAGGYLISYRRRLGRGDPLNPFGSSCSLWSNWARPVSADGLLTGPEMWLAPGGSNAFSQGAFEQYVHYEVGDNMFVQFGRMLMPAGCSPGGAGGFFAVQVDGNGIPLGAPSALHDFVPELGDAPLGRPAYDCTRGRFLVTWVRNLGSQFRLDGRIVGLDGTPIGPSFPISRLLPPGGFNASAAFDPLRDRYLVVYPTTNADIRARLVSPAGVLLSKERVLVADTGELTGPALLRSEKENMFVLGWLKDNVAGRVAAYDLDLNLIRERTIASQGVGEVAEEFWPSLVEHPHTGDVLFIWPDVRSLASDGEWDIFGQMLQPN